MTDAVKARARSGLPARQGFMIRQRAGSCGVGFIADMKNRKSHAIVEQGLAILKNLDHRGAVGADPKMGDGCGILVRSRTVLLAEMRQGRHLALPEPAQYGVGHLFMPRDPEGFRSSRRSSQGDRRRGACTCSAGATCPWTTRTSARA
jgi:glutamate synthase (NADPH/NADH) large chain